MCRLLALTSRDISELRRAQRRPSAITEDPPAHAEKGLERLPGFVGRAGALKSCPAANLRPDFASCPSPATEAPTHRLSWRPTLAADPQSPQRRGVCTPQGSCVPIEHALRTRWGPSAAPPNAASTNLHLQQHQRMVRGLISLDRQRVHHDSDQCAAAQTRRAMWRGRPGSLLSTPALMAASRLTRVSKWGFSGFFP